MAEKNFITVKVLDLAGVGVGCACSKSPGGPEHTAAIMRKCQELTETLESSYPGRTRTEFIDLAQTAEAKQSEAAQLLVTGQYPTPLVVIADEPRFAGSIQVNRIVKEVGKILNP